jgi:hypothetical protein
MRKWGIIISLFYALVVLVLLVPGALLISGDKPLSTDFYHDLGAMYASFWIWILIAVLLAGQALLLFVSVDTQWRRLRPRAHVLVTTVATTALILLLALSALTCLIYAVNHKDDDFGLLERYLSNVAVLSLFAIWLLWAGLFYLYARKYSGATTRAVTWLLRGSILELLVAVPCHVIVRRREECCAPVVTGLGITTGLAIMLLSFGPSVLFLYKRRLDGYAKRKAS